VRKYTLLVGVTAPFAVYSAASSSLGIVMGPLGIVGIPMVVMGLVGLKGYKQHRRALLAGLVAELHSKLHVKSSM